MLFVSFVCYSRLCYSRDSSFRFHAFIVRDLIIQRDVTIKKNNDTIHYSPLFWVTKDGILFSPCVVEVVSQGEWAHFIFQMASGRWESTESKKVNSLTLLYCAASLDISAASTFCKNLLYSRESRDVILLDRRCTKNKDLLKTLLNQQDNSPWIYFLDIYNS